MAADPATIETSTERFTGVATAAQKPLCLSRPHGRAWDQERDLVNDELKLSLKRCPPRGTAEISRYAVSKMFRRREGETQYADTGFFEADHSRRLVPHITWD